MGNDSGKKKRLSKEVVSDSEKEDSGIDDSHIIRTTSTLTAESGTEGEEALQPRRNADNELFFELSSRRRVTLRKWRGSNLIDIREYWGEEGALKPGKKGISLSVEQWRSLIKLTPALEKAIDQSK